MGSQCHPCHLHHHGAAAEVIVSIQPHRGSIKAPASVKEKVGNQRTEDVHQAAIQIFMETEPCTMRQGRRMKRLRRKNKKHIMMIRQNTRVIRINGMILSPISLQNNRVLLRTVTASHDAGTIKVKVGIVTMRDIDTEIQLVIHSVSQVRDSTDCLMQGPAHCVRFYPTL